MADKERAINLAEGKDLKDDKKKPQEIPNEELTTEQRNYKRQSIKEHLDQLVECLHYAKQDAAAYVLNMNINNPEKRAEAERAVADTEKEIAQYREKLSRLN